MGYSIKVEVSFDLNSSLSFLLSEFGLQNRTMQKYVRCCADNSCVMFILSFLFCIKYFQEKNTK